MKKENETKIQIITKKAVTALFYLLRLFPIKKNKIVFSNFFGNGYGCNPKYIAEELLRQNINAEIIWLVNDLNYEMPSGISKVKYGSLSAYYHLATAKVWIDNCRKPYYIKKRRAQFYVQTWHGGNGPKNVEKYAMDRLPAFWVKNSINDSKMIDIIMSNSEFNTKIIKEAFWYDGEIMKVGSPRRDIFFGSKVEEIRQKVMTKLDLDLNSKVLLYAPTLRKGKAADISDINFEKLQSVLESTYLCPWIIMIRLHPMERKKFDFTKCGNKRIIDVGSYPDIQELYTVADMLVTDYSSVMMEYSITRKPVFLYAADVEIYKKDRGFCFDEKMLPFKLAQSSDELINNIISFDRKDYEQRLDKFISWLKPYDSGIASKECVKRICKEIVS
jgi:CDP-glycerol glycerophosphotransferase